MCDDALLLCSSTDDTGPMQEYNTNALMALKGQLKVKVKMMGLIDDLSKAAGGFLNEVEVLSVQNKPNDFEQMGQVIEILIGKTNGDFNVFCNLLRKWDYAGWANDLETKAREFRGPGTHVKAGSGLLHSSHFEFVCDYLAIYYMYVHAV